MTGGLSANLDGQREFDLHRKHPLQQSLEHHGTSWNFTEIKVQLIFLLNHLNLHFPGYTMHRRKVTFKLGRTHIQSYGEQTQIIELFFTHFCSPSKLSICGGSPSKRVGPSA